VQQHAPPFPIPPAAAGAAAGAAGGAAAGSASGNDDDLPMGGAPTASDLPMGGGASGVFGGGAGGRVLPVPTVLYCCPNAAVHEVEV
jgi:hypothetical protein